MGRLNPTSLTYMVKNTFVEVGGAHDDTYVVGGDTDDIDCAMPLKMDVPDTPSPILRPHARDDFLSMPPFSIDGELGLPPPAFSEADFVGMAGCFDGQEMNGMYMQTMMFDPVTGNYMPYCWGMPMDHPANGAPVFDGQVNAQAPAPNGDEAADVAPPVMMDRRPSGFGSSLEPVFEDPSQHSLESGVINDQRPPASPSWRVADANSVQEGSRKWSDDHGDWSLETWDDAGEWDRRHDGDAPWIGDNTSGGVSGASASVTASADAQEPSPRHADNGDQSPESFAEDWPRSRGKGRNRKQEQKSAAGAQQASAKLSPTNAGSGGSASDESTGGAAPVLNGPVNYTTVMLRNIPNKYTREMLVDQLSQEFRGNFDFVYLPIDFKNRCNVGYGFINFRTVAFCDNFVSKFNGVDVRKCLPGLNSRKVAEVTPARVQGLDENVRRLRNSPVMNELISHPEWMPLLLNPSGEEMEFPLPEQPCPPVKPRRRGREDRNREN